MEQSFTPAQYFFGIVFTMACILYIFGIYLVMKDKYEEKKRRRNGDFK